MSDNREAGLRPETLAIHAGRVQLGAVRPVAQPIVLSSSYQRDEAGELPAGFMYSRHGNPNRAALEQCLAALEGGVECAAFGSGSAATMAVFQSLRPGDHVLVAQNAYYGTIKLVRDLIVPWGLEVTLIDPYDLAQVAEAFRTNTRLVWVETISNPMMRVADIAGISRLAHERGALVAVDNTFTTPLLCRPIELGADLVVHATSKYLAGHSDVVGGAVITGERAVELFSRVRTAQTIGGAVPGPFDCWLVQRGIRTLAVRLRAACESAAKIAEFLFSDERVSAVHFPGLQSHPDFEQAQRQFNSGGAMISFQVRAGAESARQMCLRTRIFTCATSLGGVESLIEHRATVEGKGTSTPADLIRLSIGLEHVEDLIADLSQALG